MADKDISNIGLKIKEFRERKEISIEEMSKRSGLPVDLIEHIEHDHYYPGLSPLIKISRVLGTRLGTFLDSENSSDCVVVKKEQRKDTVRFLSSQKDSASLIFESLGQNKKDRNMEPFYVTLPPESSQDAYKSSHEGEEFIFILKGQVEIFHGEKTHILEEGDSIYYDSIVPHNVHSYQGQEAVILAIVFTP